LSLKEVFKRVAVGLHELKTSKKLFTGSAELNRRIGFGHAQSKFSSQGPEFFSRVLYRFAHL
jgi:hypothetical protein